MSKHSCAKYCNKNTQILQKRCMIDMKTNPKKKQKKETIWQEQCKTLLENIKQRLVEYRKRII